MNASPPETASQHSTNAEQQSLSSAHQQHQQQQQQQQTQQQQQPHQHSQQQHHHVHCSYEKEVVCDESQLHQLQHQHQQHPCDQRQLDDHQPHYHTPLDQLQQAPLPQSQQQQHQPRLQHQHQHHQQRKQHSHSPYHSRHTSPHSHHSHSLHSSPHQSHPHVHECNSSDMRRGSIDSSARNHHQHAINNTNSSHSSHHHHVHRRRKRQANNHHHSNGTHSGNSSGSHAAHSSHHDRSSSSRPHQHGSSCSRRHRSATDVSTTSINTCHEPLCADREVQEILVRKNCCISSRTELAQYFAEDLYGSSRRPSSCCTSSDYCYHTDSTSLYGSRSSLSRNNSIKSASVAMRKKRIHQRQPSYTSISLRGLNTSRPNSQLGSLTSIFDRAKKIAESNGAVDAASGKPMIVSPSKVTIERQSSSKDALNKELPDYACSPSPIRWSFLADGKSPTEFEGAVGGGSSDGATRGLTEQKHERIYVADREHCRHEQPVDYHPPILSKRKLSHDERPSTSSASRKCRDSPFSCDFEESTTVLFHQEGEPFNNCCSNYIQCNTYLDQDLQITSEDIHQYLSKGNQQIGDILNNSKNYPFQPSNALEFQYKNNFANNNGATPSETGDSVRGGYDGRFRRNSSKETNLNQNAVSDPSGCVTSSCASTPLSPTDINLSLSSNNINIVFNTYTESNANEVKFINTTRDNAVSTEAHHSGYLPYTYPSYDYTNMSANLSLFVKPIGIDAIPNIAEGAGSSSTTGTDGQHSSSLQSPEPGHTFVVNSFDSFDTASENNLLSRRSSCQFSPVTPRSPLSPGSPATTSSISASIDPPYPQQYYPGGAGVRQQRTTAHSPSMAQQHDPYRYTSRHHHHHHHHHHFTEGFKLSNAFKRVRKRARKYADLLRKK